jgi:hypothetical protein
MAAQPLAFFSLILTRKTQLKRIFPITSVQWPLIKIESVKPDCHRLKCEGCEKRRTLKCEVR